MNVGILRFASYGLAMAAIVAGTLFLLFGPLFGDRISGALRDACIQAKNRTVAYCSDPP
jgi:hypothetical protein